MRNRLLAIAAAVPLLAWAPAAVAGPAGGPAGAAPAAGGPCGTVASPPAYQHVIWIWMENHSFGAIIGSPQAPYIHSLAGECGLAANYHNITHRSLPNYVGATSGLGYRALAKFTGDCDPRPGCVTAAPSLFGQGETWRAYEESMPANCALRNSGTYLVHHNPPPYFTTLRGCGASDVPYSRFAGDLAGNRLPAFSFITPNKVDDMHAGSITAGDTWLARNLPPILRSPEYTSGSTAV